VLKQSGIWKEELAKVVAAGVSLEVRLLQITLLTGCG